MHHDQILIIMFILVILYIIIQMLYKQLFPFLLNLLHQQLSIIQNFMLSINLLQSIILLLIFSLLNSMNQLLLNDQLLLLIHLLSLLMQHSHSLKHQHLQFLLFNLLIKLLILNFQVISLLIIAGFIFNSSLIYLIVIIINQMNLVIKVML